MSHPSLRLQDHRPFPIPAGRWTWSQAWCDLLFLHWPVPAAALRPFVPSALRIQEFDGTAWIGLVPFRLEGIARRPFPPVPGFSGFPELNVRTYVEHSGRPGIWFLSIDGPNRIANWTARHLFGFPYLHADVTYSTEGKLRFESRRKGGGPRFRGTFAPKGAPRAAQAGTLEHFLTERYRYTAHGRNSSLLTGDVHHEPWPLQDADYVIHHNGMLEPFGIPPADPRARRPALVHYARRVHSVVWPVTRV